MVAEVLQHLRPAVGEVAVDCTLGGGGHAQAILARLQPGGRLIGIDVDSIELPRTEKRLRAAGFGPDAFVAHHANFSMLEQILATEHVGAANVILADLGVSSMQHDSPERGFSFRGVGPLDMRMDPSQGETAAQLIARLDEQALAALLAANADEPRAALIAGILKRELPETTHALTRLVRIGLTARLPALPKADVKMSVRRTLQGLRISVNDEFAALEGLLLALPQCLAPAGQGDCDVSLRRRSPGEEGLAGRPSVGSLFGGRRSGGALDQGRNVCQPPRVIREIALGRSRLSASGDYLAAGFGGAGFGNVPSRIAAWYNTVAITTDACLSAAGSMRSAKSILV